jgi:DNA invertase Pin-like site-specific DNA recombinase
MATTLPPQSRWTEPPATAREQLPLRPKIAYTRKSSEAADMQMRSHDQQMAAILAEHPSIFKHFRDDKSGKTFDDRPGIQTMLRWCQVNDQPRSAPGTILMYDKSRFGRALIPGTDETDWIAYDKARLAFAECGWELEFITGNKSENKVVNRILDTLDDEQSSEYIRRLRRNVKRGQEDSIKAGFWPRGIAPFPCVRIDARTGRVLGEAQRDENGVVLRDAEGKALRPAERVQPGAHVVLGAHPERLRHWVHGARLLLEGRPWRDVVKYYDTHVPTARGSSRWTRKGLIEVYSNRALIGSLVRKVDGKRMTFQASWEPIVDPELFQHVQQEIARRAEENKFGTRQRETDYLLPLRCAHCGTRYQGGFKKGGGNSEGRRYYVHPEPNVDGRIGDRETEARARQAGCRTYRIPADYIEGRVADLLASERGSEGWREAIERRFADAEQHRGATDSLVTTCRKRLETLHEELESLAKAVERAKGATLDHLLARLDTKHEEIAEAEADLAGAAMRITTGRRAREETLQIISDTAAIAKGWETMEPERRRRVIDWWVRGIEVIVEPVPGKTKGMVLQKSLNVFLHTAPKDPRVVTVPGTLRMLSDSSNHRTPLNDTEEWRLDAELSARATAASGESQTPQSLWVYRLTLPGILRTRHTIG